MHGTPGSRGYTAAQVEDVRRNCPICCGLSRSETRPPALPRPPTLPPGALCLDLCMFSNDGSNRGMLSASKPSGAYFLHLSPLCGAKVVELEEAALTVTEGDVAGAEAVVFRVASVAAVF